ncbi:MAG: Nramp family divalent metal transporter [bacterium]
MVAELKKFPKAISIWKLMGPSFIILALGLGSGEVILWPYLTSNFGLGLAWGALLGISFQYFINMEIERYALVKGESVFVGLVKKFKFAPYWFILSTFLGFALPGIIAASAQALATVFGWDNFKWLAMGLLIFVGVILSIGKIVYTMMERITKLVIFIGVPLIFIITLYLAKSADWIALGQGLVGIGDGYYFLPEGIALATFLAAFAYSGAGGNLNLSQSIYIKEKGYGMGKYSQKISGLFKIKKEQEIKLTGERFDLNQQSIHRFHIWWKRINTEHLIVFWFIGLLAMSLLMLLSYITAYGANNNAEGINFVINQGIMIGKNIFPWIGSAFLIIVGIMLFQTQLGVLDSTSRIMAENVALKMKKDKINLSKIYFIFVWSQIAFGVILFLLNIYEPKTLIVIGAVINAVAMFVHVGLVSRLNHTSLPKVFRPRIWRRIVILIIFVFFGVFSAITLFSKFGWIEVWQNVFNCFK